MPDSEIPFLTIEQARLLHLVAQGIEPGPVQPAGPSDPLAAIRRMGVLQIDTISVVSRSQYLVLWSRIGNYDRQWLDDTLNSGDIYEAWSHAASYLPTEVFALHRGRRTEQTAHRKQIEKLLGQHRAAADQMLEHVRVNGEVRAADFERKESPSSGWWDWKEEKLVLELLFLNDELLVKRRDRFQRVYDLPERVHPEAFERPIPDLDSTYEALAIDSVRALGIATIDWVSDYYRLPYRASLPAAKRAMETDRVFPVEIDGIGRAFVHESYRKTLESILAGKLIPGRTTILSPFDPIVWHRERASSLFGFDYLIECYTPESKRIYGYFTLPILHRGRLVGRLDAKAHRSAGRMEIKAIHFEPGVELTQELQHDLAATLIEFADWHGTPEVEIVRSNPKSARVKISKQIREQTKRTGKRRSV